MSNYATPTNETDNEAAPLLSADESGNSPAPAAPPSLVERWTTALHEPKDLNGLEKLLALAVLGLFLAAVAGFSLFVGYVVKFNDYKRDHQGPDWPSPLPGPPYTVTKTQEYTQTVPGPTQTVPSKKPHKGGPDELCLSPSCVSLAANVLNALDTTVDPCDDFYGFANGGWLKANPIPDGLPMFGAAQKIGVNNKIVIRNILENEPTGDVSAADRRNIQVLQKYWQSCMAEDVIESHGPAPFMAVLEEVISAFRGSVKIPSVEPARVAGQVVLDTLRKAPKHNPKTRVDRLTNALMFLHSRQIPSLFEVYPEGDVKVDPKHLVLWLKQAELGLPAKDYYEEDDVLGVYEKSLAVLLHSVYAQRNELTIDTAALAKDVVDFETKLAAISLDPEQLEDPATTYNPKTSNELANLFPAISFANYFASFTPRPDYPSPVIVTSPKYLKDLTKILDDVDDNVLEGYFITRSAQALSSLLGTKTVIRQQVENIDNYLAGVGEGVRKPRSDTCITSLSESLGFLIGRYYVQEAFAGDSKEYAEEIIVSVIDAFKSRLPELEWLDDETRAAAEEKADAITHKIGGSKNPDIWDPLSLERYYSINHPIEKDDYFGNTLRARLADQRRSWVSVGGKQDKNKWDMIPSEVNAYYSPPANEIAFPAGILQFPYFSKTQPEFMSFGSFGAVAGHELTHAFDQSGRQYNKDGLLTDWWTNGTVARFEELKQCMLDQYKQYAVYDASGKPYYVQSSFTNGEDMADLGGLSQAYYAWKGRFDNDPKGEKYDNTLLPGLEKYSREQLFFVAYAQGWARNISPQEAVRRIRVDPHSPTHFRVKGPLVSMSEFKDAFQCKKGDRMVKDEPCSIW